MNSDEGRDTKSGMQFQDELFAKTLQSERLRAKLLAGAGCVLSAAFLAAYYLVDSEFTQLLRSTTSHTWIMGLSMGLVLYELAIVTILGRFIQHRKHSPTPVRYLNSFIETSMPSVAIIVTR